MEEIKPAYQCGMLLGVAYHTDKQALSLIINKTKFTNLHLRVIVEDDKVEEEKIRFIMYVRELIYRLSVFFRMN